MDCSVLKNGHSLVRHSRLVSCASPDVATHRCAFSSSASLHGGHLLHRANRMHLLREKRASGRIAIGQGVLFCRPRRARCALLLQGSALTALTNEV